MGGIAVLGPLQVNGGDAPLGPRDRVVLEALAVRSGDVLSAERLADALWADAVPHTWAKVVQGCVVRLRKAIGAEAIETLPQGYRLNLATEEIDARRFERLIRRSHELLVLGEHERAVYVSGEALALWRGPPFSALESWEPGHIEACRLEELRLDAEEVHIDAALRAGRHRDVLGEAEARAVEAPLRERRWALLALAQYQAGRQADALRSLRQARRVLVAELGLEPGPDLVALEQAILRQDPSLVAAVALPEAIATCPYRGLVAYDVGDADTYFGRERDVQTGLQRLAETGVLAVVGPSGGGKSSLVRAGVAAALQRQGRAIRVITPGPHPTQSITGLRSITADTVLVVDQCEEVFTLCLSVAERTAFLDALGAHAAHSPLVVALRADRLGDLAAHPAFARLVERGLHLLGAMDDEDLRTAIETPARQYGLLLEAGLVEVLVGEVEGEPGALPLLSHALLQTWARREDRTLTVAGYRQSGGIRGAVAQSAEQVYGQIPAEQRLLLRDLMLRLVTPTAEGDPVSNRIARQAVVTDDERQRLVDRLVDARLVTSDEHVVELAHESLARAWPRLREWLDADVEGQRMFRHLAAASEAWDDMGRPDSELYRGPRLAQALEWRDRSRPDCNPIERQFLADAEALEEREHRSAEDRARHASRVNKKLRILLAGVAAALVVAIVAGLLAVRQADRADRTAEQAEQAAIAADARRIGAQALVTDNIDDSLLMAAAGVRLDDSPDTRANLLSALTRHPALIAAYRSTEPVLTVDASFDGGVVAVGDPFGGVVFRDAVTLAPLGSFPDPPWTLKFRPGGSTMAMATNPYVPNGPQQLDPVPVVIIDSSTFELSDTQLGGQPGPRSRAVNIEYSADGRYLAAAFEVYGNESDEPTAGAVVVWDLSFPQQPVRRFDAASLAEVGWLGLSPDGSLLYSGGFDGTLSVSDVGTGELVRSAEIAHVGGEVSPDGAVVAAADGRDVVLLDAATLTEQRRLEGQADLTTLQFSRDGSRFASGYDDGTVIVWDVATGAVQDQFTGHAGGVSELAFAPDGDTLYTVSFDRSVLAWDLDGSRRFVAISQPATPGNADYAIVAPTGDRVVYVGGLSGNADTVQFLDLTDNHMSAVIPVGHGGIGDVRTRPPEYGEVATSGRDQMVRIWDPHTGRLLREHDINGERIAYSADGERIVVGESEGSVTVIDADTLEPVAPSFHLGHGVLRLFASPDGRTAIALTDEPGIALIDIVDRRVLHEHAIERDPIAADFSPDGERVAIGTGTGEVGILDVATGDWIRPPAVGHRDTVVTVAYAPDGNTVVSGGLDGRVALWEGNTGAALGAIVARHNVATGAGFAPDGHTVIIASADGTVARWDTDVEQWIATSCKIAGRSLTPTEWADILADRTYVDTCQHDDSGQ